MANILPFTTSTSTTTTNQVTNNTPLKHIPQPNNTLLTNQENCREMAYGYMKDEQRAAPQQYFYMMGVNFKESLDQCYYYISNTTPPPTSDSQSIQYGPYGKTLAFCDKILSSGEGGCEEYVSPDSYDIFPISQDDFNNLVKNYIGLSQ